LSLPMTLHPSVTTPLQPIITHYTDFCPCLLADNSFQPQAYVVLFTWSVFHI
jgi:hypothetical protein